MSEDILNSWTNFAGTGSQASLYTVVDTQMKNASDYLKNGQMYMPTDTVRYKPENATIAEKGYTTAEDTAQIYDKKEIYDDFKSKVSFYRDSTTGLQLSSLQLQGDFVTTLQRAFMEQNKTKIRRMAHATTETENASILLRANVALKSYFLLH